VSEAALQGPASRSVQVRGFVAAWLGWAFDGLDGFLYTLVAIPFVKELLEAGASKSEVAAKASLIQGVFLIGWAIGGAFFGRVGDRLGRSRTLTWTILTYAVFTGLSYFAQAWWQLLIFRFVAALGIGGEWAAGSALVAETVHARHRAWASATLQSAYMVGMILAAAAYLQFHAHPRDVFLVGVVPAIVTLWIRRAVPEPEVWKAERTKTEMPPMSALFATGVRATTLLTLGLTCISLTTVWAFLYFSVQAIRGLPEAKAMAPADLTHLIVSVTIIYSLVNIASNYVATYFAKAIGNRLTFGIYFVGCLLSFLIGFGHPRSLEETRLWINIAAFFCLGLFAPFPLYIPPLFPTLIRTTGAGFTYNFGRLVAGVGTFFLGAITVDAGKAIFYAGLLYIPGIALAFFIREPYARTEAAPAPA